ncbi:MAG: hypothetical protein DLM53_03530 [Candidatus Eremiobacter antarcticus]|nr:stage II sporulation protein M [Candidatus Eremiobacteraeota bacterium]MBC5807344.1 stage II sporulation protein M [Candidatus Eremiobacteraeota bacterium]PZR63097.1 MAG: hypothetical protein DLM53_03530 [Candidatus Eremiobacter sp. RRmetagenome_bin22]
MRQAAFVNQRQAGWQQLEALLSLAERRGLRRLEPEQVAELGTLYRWLTSDLAFANARRYDVTLQAYLNRLTARAHALVYARRQSGGVRTVIDFYRRTFPAEVRASRAPIAICAGVFIAASVAAYALISAQPLNAYVLLPAQLIQPIHHGLHETNFEPAVRGIGTPTLSAEIMTNNVRLAFLAFAGGVTLGILTLYLLIFNGLTLGGMAALYAQAGFGRDFAATVAPHGVIELSAVQIAAGAGLLLAAAVLSPGRLRRVDAMRRNGRRAGVLILGVASMLVVAAAIEGGFSPQKYSQEARIAFGVITAALMLAYFLLAGREKSAEAASP